MKHLENLVSQQVEQLKNAERLSAIGQTAGMIGHDIRNPLQAIWSETYLVRKAVNRLPESEEKKSFKESISNIEENLSYIDKIVADLQDFAKPPKPTLEQVVSGKNHSRCNIRHEYSRNNKSFSYTRRQFSGTYD